MTAFLKPYLLVWMTVCLLNACKNSPETLHKPNIIFILADDLGYGDLGCYGQERIETPNIDRLASEGMRFTQHYAGSTVCAPSRSVLMSGRHTGHTYIRGNREHGEEGQFPLADSVRTIAELLKDQGYVTGAFGKWGLGFPGSEGDPMNQGFDRFFGYNCQRLAHHYYPYHLWDDREKILLEENAGTQAGTYAPIRIHEKAIEFIESCQDTSFFLYIPSIIPHAELLAPEEYTARYRGLFLPEKTYQGVDSGPNFRQGAYGSQPESHAAFAAMMTILDEQVGAIMEHIKMLGLEQKTVIFVSSDNGPHLEGGADPDYFNSNGPFRGYKRDLYEGGIRVPFIAWWPGMIEPGSESDHVSAFWDLYPTLAGLAGADITKPVDGISFLPTLTGKGTQEQHEYLYWEFFERGGRVAVRKDQWKAVKYNIRDHPDGPLELYDLSRDPGEQYNVASLFPEMVATMEEILGNARTESKHFRFPQ